MASFISKLALSSILAQQVVQASKGGPEPEWLTELRKQREKSNGPDGKHYYVHLINHTHDDVGWLKTVDEYYSGTKQNIQAANVSQVLDEVVQELVKNPDRKFTYVEMKFFSMWWVRQNETVKSQVKTLVSNGQLEFVNAGWSMHDEACTHHDDMMNNMMVGHEFLEKEFGYRPRIAWSIDPFGHSNAHPRLLADMGFDGWFYARLDYEDREKRLQEQSMNYIWRPMFDSLSDNVEIFTGAMRDHYCWIPGFWTDQIYDGDDPVVSDEKLATFNAQDKSLLISDYVKEMIKNYKGTHMLIPFGCDFSFGNARMNFKSTDNLIAYFNSHVDDITLIYSTPSMYLDALKSQEITWPTKYDDMFPYADQPEDYWTGYFTSRANAKSEVRFGQADLHASNKVYALRAIDQQATETEVELILYSKYVMFDAMGVYQHHDGITGTAKQAVANDYTKRLQSSITTNNEEYASQIAGIVLEKSGLNASDWAVCSSRYGTYRNCPTADFSKTFYVAAHNPAAVLQKIQKIKVKPGTSYAVNVDSQGVWTQVDTNLECYNYQLNGGSSQQDCNLFINSPVLPNDVQFFQIVPGGSPISGTIYQSTLNYTGQSTEDAARFSYMVDGKTIELEFQLRYYNPATPLTEILPQDGDNCPSGAYIFKPAHNDQSSHSYSKFLNYVYQDSSFMHSDILRYKSSDAEYTAIVRNYQGSDVVEFEVQMTGIQSSGLMKGKEVIATWQIIGFDNKKTFYTDSNGLEMQKRVIDFRPTWDLVTNEHVSGNYYPVNSAIAIRDTTQMLQMTVMNDRSQGGSVIETGRVELMQNRRLYFDDARGVGEPLNETDSNGYGIQVDAIYKVQIFNTTTGTSQQRQTQLVTDEPVQYFYSETAEQQEVTPPAADAFSYDFYGHLKIHMFPENKNQILIRVENIADLFDGPVYGTPRFDLVGYANHLYKSVNGAAAQSVTITERTLGNNQDYVEWANTKYQWTTVDGPGVPYPLDVKMIALQPQRIRLFKVVYNSQTQTIN